MGKAENTMSIGVLSRQSGIGIETIRYYERLGLLTPVGRKTSGYRVFNNDSFKTLRFLKHAQELGFSLAEIKDLLKLRANKESRCEDVRVKASKHLQGVESKIEKLESIRTVLSKLIRQCRSKKTSDSCPILDCFEERM
ncbi:MAG: heavy metal-responsive transcriptional regulator [Pseudomonadota bacterium]|nr:heavy metal-responsive transcriptional regulator [Pseudomonadota bacterium]